MTPRFPPGQFVATPGALQAFAEADESPLTYLRRHLAGDWGELDEEDRQENERSLAHGLRLFSAYLLNNGTRLWIITVSDRSATTLLLPEEY